MTDTETVDAARRKFRDGVTTYCVDLGRMAQWVLEHDFAVPESDPYVPSVWTIYATSPAVFDDLAQRLAFDGQVTHERSERYRTVRRQFGAVAVEVVGAVTP